MDLGHSDDMLDALLMSILEGIFIPPKSSIPLLFFLETGGPGGGNNNSTASNGNDFE